MYHYIISNISCSQLFSTVSSTLCNIVWRKKDEGMLHYIFINLSMQRRANKTFERILIWSTLNDGCCGCWTNIKLNLDSTHCLFSLKSVWISLILTFYQCVSVCKCIFFPWKTRYTAIKVEAKIKAVLDNLLFELCHLLPFCSHTDLFYLRPTTFKCVYVEWLTVKGRRNLEHQSRLWCCWVVLWWEVLL